MYLLASVDNKKVHKKGAQIKMEFKIFSIAADTRPDTCCRPFKCS